MYDQVIPSLPSYYCFEYKNSILKIQPRENIFEDTLQGKKFTLHVEIKLYAIFSGQDINILIKFLLSFER